MMWPSKPSGDTSWGNSRWAKLVNVFVFLVRALGTCPLLSEQISVYLVQRLRAVQPRSAVCQLFDLGSQCNLSGPQDSYL